MTTQRVISAEAMARAELALEGDSVPVAPLGRIVDDIGIAIRQFRYDHAVRHAETLAAAATIVAERQARKIPKRWTVYRPDSSGQAIKWYQGAFGPNYIIHIADTIDHAAIYDDKDEAERVVSSLNSRDEYRNSFSSWQVGRLVG